MEYVKISAIHGGRSLDPEPYLAALPTISTRLPAGAHAFATDPDHYDFGSRRCVKDLTLASVSFDQDGDGRSIELQFRHNCWKHEEDLTVRYRAVADYRVDLSADVIGQSSVMLDEIVPHDAGCQHEIGFVHGSIVVTCGDLVASWSAADCPDK